MADSGGMDTPTTTYTPTVHPYASVPLVLLSGVGRSGTTALRASLSLHPEIDSTERENNIIYDLLDAAWRNRTLPARRYGMRVDDPTYDARFRDLILSLLWPSPRRVAPSRLLAFSNVTPTQAEYLVQMFPGAKIVYLVRNGIEVISSRMRFENFSNRSVDEHSRVWSYAAGLARWGADRGDFLLARHENLIGNGGPAAEINRIFEFMGLPTCAKSIENMQSTTYHPTPEKPASQSEAKPLETRAERWRDWTAEQIAAFDAHCAEAMTYFGYQRPWVRGGATTEMESEGRRVSA